jgi:hypothetical protein
VKIGRDAVEGTNLPLGAPRGVFFYFRGVLGDKEHTKGFDRSMVAPPVRSAPP